VADLLVIGAGLAGLMAAYTAAQAGQRVHVISTGLGALHWSAGGIDVLGYYPDGKTPVERPLDTLAELGKAQPAHPYALVGEQGVREALRQFETLTEELSLPYAGAANGEENIWLPSPAGAARPTARAPRGQMAGDLRRPEPMLIVGFAGLRDFFPELIAANLGKQGCAARAVFLPLDLITDMRDRNTVQLAQALDEPARRNVGANVKRLGGELKKLVRPGERIGLPAILGFDDHIAALRELETIIGAPVFEIPTLPPSVPGIRLMNALRRKIERMGVRVDVNMLVNGYHVENNRVVWVETETSARPLKHRAENFLLATGGILGGGINTDHTGKVWEVALNLPVAAPARRTEWFRPRFLDPAGHPIFRAGVTVNCDFQPVDAQGARVYTNVWAAGGVLAQADPILTRSVEGIAIATGVAAAKHVIRDA
jgi:glycerol-3-phosphate dehydrogenase subunit B